MSSLYDDMDKMEDRLDYKRMVAAVCDISETLKSIQEDINWIRQKVQVVMEEEDDMK